MRISFPAFSAAWLAFALGGPLAAEEVSFTNATPGRWILVWAPTLEPGATPPFLMDDPEEMNIIEPGETLVMDFENPGFHRARLYDFNQETDCLLQVTYAGTPATSVLDVLPDWGEGDSVRKVVERTSARAVTFRGPFERAAPKPAHLSQKEAYREAKGGRRTAAWAAGVLVGLAAAAAAPAPAAPAPAAPGPAVRALDFGPADGADMDLE